MQIFQLSRFDFGRSIHQRIGSALRFRESDRFAQVGAAGQQHHQTVEAEGETAVRRRTIFKGIQQITELILGLFRR
ncbi:hypothetical protein D1872_285520 [compost metagenome]